MQHRECQYARSSTSAHEHEVGREQLALQITELVSWQSPEQGPRKILLSCDFSRFPNYAVARMRKASVAISGYKLHGARQLCEWHN